MCRRSIRPHAVALAKEGVRPSRIAAMLGSTVGSIKVMLSQDRAKGEKIPLFYHRGARVTLAGVRA